MFNEEQKYLAKSAMYLTLVSPYVLTIIAKNKVKKTAKEHPLATTIVGGVAGGTVLAVALINGEQAPETSVYAKLFR